LMYLLGWSEASFNIYRSILSSPHVSVSQHEIIGLYGDGIFRTTPYAIALQLAFQQCASQDSFTVTFVGSTHAGKSFIIRELMSIRDPEKSDLPLHYPTFSRLVIDWSFHRFRPPTVGRPAYLEKEGGGTSLNACCYFERLKNTILEDHICKFIDMEVRDLA